MLYLITGLPGNGKTLYALDTVRRRAQKEQRSVYYSGIPDLAIPDWIEFEDPEKWYELPEGAIILIDEAQRAFRPRPGRGGVPPHVEQLETHRHKGFDIYLITQHPTLIDNNVRRLAGTHWHVVRTFGMERAVIHEWGEVHLDCERNRRDSSKSNWSYPRDVYKLYKSATMHTHKRQIPKQVWYLLACLAVFGICAWLVVDGVGKAAGGAPEHRTSEPTHDELRASFTGEFAPQASREKAPMTAQEFGESLIPRVPGWAHTAPRYDEVTKPVEAPVIAGCVAMRDECSCYSQRGTRIDASPDQCKQILERGAPFYDFHYAQSGGSPAIQQQRTEPIVIGQGGQLASAPRIQSGGTSSAWGGIPANQVWGGVR